MDNKKLQALAAEMAKGLKTEAGLNAFSCMLTKLTVETTLNTELTDHLGHEKNAPKSSSNTRNRYSSKTLLCDDGEIERTCVPLIRCPAAVCWTVLVILFIWHQPDRLNIPSVHPDLELA